MDSIAEIVKVMDSSNLIFAIVLFVLFKIFESKLSDRFKKLESELDQQTKTLESELKKSEERFSKSLDYDINIDQDIRKQRLISYQNLWQKMKVVPKYPQNDKLVYEDLQKLCTDFKNWYFEDGGVFLSEESRVQYELVQEKLVKSFEKKKEDLVAKEYDSFRKPISLLRTEFTKDLESRRRFL